MTESRPFQSLYSCKGPRGKDECLFILNNLKNKKKSYNMYDNTLSCKMFLQ